MNHWKIMGARSLAGVLTVGMLMGQPSLIWAAESAGQVSQSAEKDTAKKKGMDRSDEGESDKTSDSIESSRVSDSQDSVSETKKPEKPEEEKDDGEKPEENGSTSRIPEGNGSDTQVPAGDGSSSDVKEPASDVPGSGSSNLPEPDKQPDPGSSVVSGLPDGSGQDSSAIPELSGSGSQIVPEEGSSGHSIVDSPSDEEIEVVEEDVEEELEDENQVQAGKDFYTDQLKSQFHMVFADNFADIMDQIEQENFDRNGLDKTDLFTAALQEAKEEKDIFHAPNWKDIVAVYVFQQKKSGESVFYFDEKHKDAIGEVYARMNPVQEVAGEKTYISFTVEDYADQENLETEDREVLARYSGRECILLCAALTSARGLIEGTFGSEVSQERADIVAAAYSLVGKISYFFGGKSTAIGWDDRWGDKREVTAEGARSTGKTRKYGLDCSGYVTWAFINGYGRASASGKIGGGTSAQWYASRTIEKDEQILPGDLVFLQGPDHDGINHVGLVVGVKDNGDVIVSHCSSGHNGVVVQEASRAGFKYIRRPKCFAEGDREVKERLKQEEKRVQEEEKKQDSPYISKNAKVKLRTATTEETVKEEKKQKEQKKQKKQVFGSLEKDREKKQEEPLLPNILQKK